MNGHMVHDEQPLADCNSRINRMFLDRMLEDPYSSGASPAWSSAARSMRQEEGSRRFQRGCLARRGRCQTSTRFSTARRHRAQRSSNIASTTPCRGTVWRVASALHLEDR